MFEIIESLMHSRIMFYGVGVGVVLLVLFTTAARSPSPQCPRCREINRPMARFCAHCGHKLDKP